MGYEENSSKEINKISDKALRSSYFRHYQALANFNYERQQANAFCYAMIPALQELYEDDEEEYIKSLERHLEFFNTTCATYPFIVGISIAMEEKKSNSKKQEFEDASINAVKASLMGPLAGIGDSFFWGTFRTIGAGIGAPMAIAGSFIGPILYFLINFIPSTLARAFGFKIGYEGGSEFLDKLSESGVLNKALEAAKIIGLTVVGGMIASMVIVNTPITLNFGDTQVVMQEILDAVMPNLLPLGLTFGIYWLLKKNISSIYITLGLILLGILGSYFNIFG